MLAVHDGQQPLAEVLGGKRAGFAAPRRPPRGPFIGRWSVLAGREPGQVAKWLHIPGRPWSAADMRILGPVRHLYPWNNEARFVPVDPGLHLSQGLAVPGAPARGAPVNSVDGEFLCGDDPSVRDRSAENFSREPRSNLMPPGYPAGDWNSGRRPT